MTKRFLLVATCAVAVVTSVAVAQAATKHKVADTVKMRTLSGTAKLIVYTGTIKDNNFGEGAIVVRLTPGATLGTFNNAATAFFKNATISVKGTNDSKSAPDGSISYTGKVKVVGGTGTAKGIKGAMTLTGTAPADDPTYSSLSIKGSVTY